MLFNITLAGTLLIQASAAWAAAVPDVQAILPRLLALDGQRRLECRGELVCSLPQLPGFYRQRGYHPAWSANGRVLPAAYDLLAALYRAPAEGLFPESYHLSAIQALWPALSAPRTAGEIPDHSRRLAELDILLTDAFLLYADHLRTGRVNPETIHKAWVAHHPREDFSGRLAEALGHNSVGDLLDRLPPPHRDYQRLKIALRSLRRLADAGGWPAIPPGPTLHPGDRDQRIPLLRQRLMVSDDLAPQVIGASDLFDIPLMTAVGHFQRRHGLKADGVVGSQTLAALNVSVGQRIRQVELNLERWRWIPRDLGPRHIRVNIADFSLKVMEAGEPVLKMAVVVGRDLRRTPVFSDTMQYLVFNPYWNVPFNIAVKDKLPLIKEDAAYLASHHFRVFASWQPDAPEVDPATVDWAGLDRTNFRVRLRQEPGPHNALGQIKFMFPNPFAVYLHDTSERDLFSQDVRTFSSGCIRVANPLGLAAYVLEDQPPWSPESIQAAMDSLQHKVITLKHPLPIHLLYWTAWAAADGTLQFRNDIYHRDPPLDQALRARLGQSGSPGAEGQ